MSLWKLVTSQAAAGMSPGMLVVMEPMMLAPGRLSGVAGQTIVAACKEMTDTGPMDMHPPHRRMTGEAAMGFGLDVGSLSCSNAPFCSPLSVHTLA